MQIVKVQLGGKDRTLGEQQNAVTGLGFRVAAIVGAGTPLSFALNDPGAPKQPLRMGDVIGVNVGSLYLFHAPIVGAGYMILQVFQSAGECVEGLNFDDADPPYHTKNGGVFSSDVAGAVGDFNFVGIACPGLNDPIAARKGAIGVVTKRIHMENPTAAALDFWLQVATWVSGGSPSENQCLPFDLSHALDGSGVITRSVLIQQNTNLIVPTAKILEFFTLPAGGILDLPRTYFLPPGMQIVLASQTANVESIAGISFDEYV